MSLNLTYLTDQQIAEFAKTPRTLRFFRDLFTVLQTLDGISSSNSTDLSNVQSDADAGLAVGKSALALATLLKNAIESLQKEAPAPHSFSFKPTDPYSIAYLRSKADIGLQKVENTALTTWPGSLSLTTLGAIATGVWQGTIVGYAYGGTGLSSVPANGQIDI